MNGTVDTYFNDIEDIQMDEGAGVNLPQFRRLLATVGIVARPGLIESNAFVSGSSGWQLTAAGNLEANTGTFRGALAASSIDIGTNAWHVDSSGNMWWGSSATYAGATIKISSAGAVNFTSGTFSGAIVTSVGTFGHIGINESSNGQLIFYDLVGTVMTIGPAGSAAIAIVATSGTNFGILMSSTVSGVGMQYNSSSNVSMYAFDSTLSGATNDGANMRLVNNGTGFGILATITASVRGIYIGSSSSRTCIEIQTSGAAPAITIGHTNNANTVIDITAGTQIAAVQIYNHVSGGNPTGIRLDVDNSSGNGYAFDFDGDIVQTSGFAGAIFRKVRVLFPSGNVGYLYAYDG